MVRGPHNNQPNGNNQPNQNDQRIILIEADGGEENRELERMLQDGLDQLRQQINAPDPRDLVRYAMRRLRGLDVVEEHLEFPDPLAHREIPEGPFRPLELWTPEECMQMCRLAYTMVRDEVKPVPYWVLLNDMPRAHEIYDFILFVHKNQREVYDAFFQAEGGVVPTPVELDFRREPLKKVENYVSYTDFDDFPDWEAYKDKMQEEGLEAW